MPNESTPTVTVEAVVAKAAEVAGLKAKAERTGKDIVTLTKRQAKEQAAADAAQAEYNEMLAQANAALAGNVAAKPAGKPSK